MSNSIEVRQRQRSRDASTTRQEQQSDDPALTQADGSPGSEFEGSNARTGISAEDARLRMLFMMRLRGFSQKEMARQFRVTTRTIRNWLPKLAGLKLPILENIDPNDEVGRILCRYEVREAELLEWKREAETVRDFKSMVAISKELRLLEKTRCDFLDRRGLFNDLRLPNFVKDVSAGQAEFLHSSLISLIEISEDDDGEDG